jgi:hypothetical protein
MELLDNFLNILKLFSGCGERFYKITMTENGWGKERKINNKLAMPILVAGGLWGLKQNLLQMEGSINCILFTQPIHHSARYSECPGCPPHLLTVAIPKLKYR